MCTFTTGAIANVLSAFTSGDLSKVCLRVCVFQCVNAAKAQLELAGSAVPVSTPSLPRTHTHQLAAGAIATTATTRQESLPGRSSVCRNVAMVTGGSKGGNPLSADLSKFRGC